MVSGFVSTAFMQHSQTQIRPWFSWVFPWKEQLSWNHSSAHTLMGENETPLNLWHLRCEMLRCWWSVKMVCHFDWSRPVVFSQFCASKSSWHVRYAGKTIIAWKGLAMLLPCFIARVPKKACPTPNHQIKCWVKILNVTHGFVLFQSSPRLLAFLTKIPAQKCRS